MRKLTLTLAALAALAAGPALIGGPALAQTAAPAPVSGAKPATAPSTPAPAAPAAKAGAASPGAGTTAKTAPLDINTATKDELDALPGIGAVRAEAILKGRPYKSKDELARKKIIPENVYNGIKDKIVAHQKS